MRDEVRISHNPILAAVFINISVTWQVTIDDSK